MGKSLNDYAATHKAQPDPERAAEVQAAIDEAAETRAGQEIKSVIAEGIQDGADPVIILYKAIKCIALFSHDEDWGREMALKLSEANKDIEQLSLLRDNLKEAEKRVNESRAAYIDRSRRRLNTLETDLKSVLQSIDQARGKINEIERYFTGI